MVKHKTVKRALRRAVATAVVAASLGIAAPASADYTIGLNAYKQGQYDQAIDIWRRATVGGDVQSMKILGDVFSGKVLEAKGVSAVPIEEIQVDNVEALMWYTLAAYHDFGQFHRPTTSEVNSRILAQQRLAAIRFRMSNSDVRKAEKLIANRFERGSAFDIYRLGRLYQEGSGVSKNNVRALTLYMIAKDRGVGEASAAFEDLESLMTKKEIELSLAAATDWQPPLPIEHRGPTKEQQKLAEMRSELEQIRRETALQAVADLDVELIQRALRSLGFYFGGIDNKTGPQTRAAIRRFQFSQVKADRKMTEAEKDAVRTGVLSAEQTVDLFREAAKNDHPMSQYVYGIMFAQGIGVESNGAEALKWLSEAAEQDLAISHYALGVLYRDGTTGLNEVTPDRPKAAIHFSRAFALGYRPAGDALRRLEWEDPRNGN
ncbi:MAG: peptidoglycan-binding protein [Pseudomonadota bacterium]